MKYECEVLKEDTELKGRAPHLVFDQCLEYKAMKEP